MFGLFPSFPTSGRVGRIAIANSVVIVSRMPFVAAVWPRAAELLGAFQSKRFSFMKTIRQMIDEAPCGSKIKDLITREQWCKGIMFVDGVGRMCYPDEAVAATIQGWWHNVYGFHHPMRTWYLHRLRNEVPGRMDFWNDAPERTFDEILSLFQKIDI